MFRIFFTFLIFLSFPAFAAATSYSTVIEDLPLMQGMQEKTDEAVIFDKPGGRIVETTAIATENSEAVKEFYAEALPPLGWQLSSAGQYTRDNETLKIDIEKKGNKAIAHFTLTPTEGR